MASPTHSWTVTSTDPTPTLPIMDLNLFLQKGCGQVVQLPIDVFNGLIASVDGLRKEVEDTKNTVRENLWALHDEIRELRKKATGKGAFIFFPKLPIELRVCPNVWSVEGRG